MNGILTGVILLGLGIVSLIIALFHFWVFPNLIIVLSAISWINITPEFINALYWLIVGLIVLFAIKSSEIKFKN